MPVDITPELSIESAIVACLEALQSRIWTALPGRVAAWDPTTQRVQVSLTVKPEGQNLPDLLDVPVSFPRAGGHILTFPVQAGDPGVVVFSTLSPAEWFNRGGVGEPQDSRRHTLSGGVFFPGADPTPVVALPGWPSKPTLGSVDNMTLHVPLVGPKGVHPIALGDVLDSLFASLDPILSNPATPPTEAAFGAFKAAYIAWKALYGASPVQPPPSFASSDANVTSG